MAELAYSYAGIIKQEKQADGTLRVYGKATDSSVDVDQQICDETWLQKAMPDWFVTGGNIREQHSQIAAGVATDYEMKADGHYITALVVDPTSVKKVEAGVLKGFSIGIRAPRVVRDKSASNGRIVDGQIVEVSLVDRPANPNAKLMLAKAADSGVLESVKQSSVPTPADVARKFNENHDTSGRFSSGEGGGSSSEHAINAHEQARMDTNASNIREAVNNIRNESTLDDHYPSQVKELQDHAKAADNAAMNSDYKTASEHIMAAGALANDLHGSTYTDASAKSQLLNIINNASQFGMTYGGATGSGFSAPWSGSYTAPNKSVGVNPGVELDTMNKTDETEKPAEETPVEPTETLEPATEEVVATEPEEQELTGDEAAEATTELLNGAKSLLATMTKFDQAAYDQAINALSDLIVVEANEMKQGSDERESIKDLLCSIKHLFRWYEGEAENGEVVNVNPEIADAEDDALYLSAKADEPEATPELPTEEAEQVEEADDLATALEAEKEKSAKLQAELEAVKALAVGGGPKRSTLNKSVSPANTAELLTKASQLRLKADAQTDRNLAQGYREWADELEAKARKA